MYTLCVQGDWKEHLHIRATLCLCIECCKHTLAPAKVILCMRHFLVASISLSLYLSLSLSLSLSVVASLRISGFCSNGHLLGLTSLSPERLYTRDVSLQRAFYAAYPLHQRNLNTWNSLLRNAPREKLETCCHSGAEGSSCQVRT